MNIVWLVPIAGVLAVLFALYLARDVLSRDTGTQAMQDVAGTIYEGAIAFIRRQYTTIALLAVVGAVVILAVITAFETQQVADTNVFGLELGIRTGIAFLVGAACSMASGIIGMYISVRSNLRTAAAARRSLVEAVQVAMRGGAVSGFLVVALSLLGVWGIFAAYGGLGNAQAVHDAPFLIVGFGFGASFVALFAQLGGGIYTKAADVGADLVGKVEAGIPEDDPRTAAENIGAMILGVLLYEVTGAVTGQYSIAWILFPLVVRAFGLVASVIGILSARVSGRGETDVTDVAALRALNNGYYIMAGVAAVFMLGVGFLMLPSGS